MLRLVFSCVDVGRYPLSESGNVNDLVIVGGGLAGMTAGVRALELGLQAVVIEKGEGESYPCNSRQSGGILHIGFLDPYRPPADLHAVIEQRCSGEADQALTTALAANGSQFIDWLQDKGTRFVRFNELESYRWCMAPPRALRAGLDWQGRGPDVLMRDLVKRFADLGGLFRSGTRAESLLMRAGVCCGVVVAKDGQSETISASHVLIADGGFQANAELFKTYIGADFDRVFQRGARTGMGDGLSMAVAAGAALKGTDRFYGHVLCRDALHNDNVWPYPEIDAIATAGVVVNGAGQRLADEGLSGVYLTNMLAQAPADEPLFAIFDAAIWDKPGQSARIPANPLLERAGGTVLQADTLVELAALTGVEEAGLIATVQRYNDALSAGTLDQLAIPRSTQMQPWPIVEAPFMAIPVCPGITYTMGGIAIDEHAQVLTSAGEPIKGLFAAGAATGGLEGGRQAGYIGGLIKAGVFGMIAAERVAALSGTSTRTPLSNAPASVPAPAQSPSSRGANSPARPARAPRLAKYPMLNGILRFGTAAAIVFSLSAMALVLWMGWPSMGIVALPVAAMIGFAIAVVTLSCAELVRLITDMLLPE
jgi:fumarate reductase flavoprotein subunit